jgi:L-asparaginase II
MCIEVLRGPVVESVHQVMAVVCDDRGFVNGYFGNTEYLTYPRSSIKLLQALPLVETGAFEKFGLDEKMLAMACASHKGEKQHLLVLTQWMEKTKITESMLQCGPAWPAHESTLHEMVRKNLQPSPLLNNCSGKHLGFLTTSLALGEDPNGYLRWEHPVQVRVRKVLTEMTKINHEKSIWGIDGCGIPTMSLPLQNLAMGFSHFLGNTPSELRKRHLKQILTACQTNPQMMAGSDDFVTAVSERTRGRCVLKSGAEGVYAGIMQDKGLCFALKVHDGHRRAAEVAAAYLFRALGAMSEAEFADLKPYTKPELKNSRGERVGEIRVQKGTA